MSGPGHVEGNGNRVTWFDPPPGDRPVEGNTIYVRPEPDAKPRVFLAGDIVPGGIWVMAPNHFLQRNLKRYRAATDLVEVLDVPEFGELVAAEKARRVKSVDVAADAASEEST